MKTIRGARAGFALLTSLGLVAACGGSSDADGTTSPVRPEVLAALDVAVVSTEAPAATPATSAPETEAPTPPADAAPATTDPAGDTETPTDSTVPEVDVVSAVATAYSAVFDQAAGDLQYLENADSHAPSIEEMRESESAAAVTVEVTSVEVVDVDACDGEGTGSPCAAVAFDLIFGGNPVIEGASGFATNEDGTWKVSSTTWCDIASLGGTDPAGC